ncbi:MAG: hypothetical protein HWE10_13420 [Gammaproteobacteria bacterium]|nr:hypothetical protein [Gammaproteobacteria bacterium]
MVELALWIIGIPLILYGLYYYMQFLQIIFVVMFTFLPVILAYNQKASQNGWIIAIVIQIVILVYMYKEVIEDKPKQNQENNDDEVKKEE